jgi:hypothetical protein
MSTSRQRRANRANAQKSTGPTSPEGKAKSCLNHLSHGLTSNLEHLIPGEDVDDLKAMVNDLMNEHLPATPTEQILVEKMAQSQWTCMRSFRLENLLFVTQRVRGDHFSIPGQISLLLRYQAAADRSFHKAHAELVKAQKERGKSEIGFESQNAGKPAKNEPVKFEFIPREWGYGIRIARSTTPDAPPAGESAPDAPEIAKTAV